LEFNINGLFKLNLLEPSNMDMSCEAKAIAVLEKRHEINLSVRVSVA
jgi:hypothetical protein